MILSISGLAGSGKDTIGDMIIKNHGFKRISFADPLKEITAKAFNLDLSYFHDVTKKDAPLPEIVIFDEGYAANLAFAFNELGYENVTPQVFSEYYGTEFRTPREILLKVGTEMGRECVSSTVWIDLAIKKIKDTDGHVLITDARFQNERDQLKAIGATKIMVNRPSVTAKFDRTKAHKSELEQLDDKYDVTIENDSTLSALYHDVQSWIGARLRSL